LRRRGGARPRRLTDRAALRIGLRLRERAGALFVHHDVAALDGLIIKLLERIGPGLTRRLAAAARIEGLAIGKRGRQLSVVAARGRDRLVHGLARIAVSVERALRVRTHRLAGLLVLGKARRLSRIRDREIVAVARAHAQRSIGVAASIGWTAENAAGPGPE